MELFNVYPLYDITPAKAQGSYLWDQNGVKYLDMYGGHAVISIGHSHPHYVKSLTEQLSQLGFYSNSVNIPIQQKLAQKLGELSDCQDYNLFLCNSGAEANENALKLASFHNGRKQVIAFSKSFHGRTAGAVAVTDNASIVAPINGTEHVTFLPFNDINALKNAISDQTCAVIVEGIQGVGGINVVSDEFLIAARQFCDQTGALLILDSVQCGYGRSGKFFTHQYTNVKPDLITIAKGMGNGFPIGGVLILDKIKAKFGLLGTTFGGNHLACAAALSVLEVIENENLIQNCQLQGAYLMQELAKINNIKELRGKGLMIGIEFEQPVDTIRDTLLFNYKIFCGYSGKNTLRLLPSLAITKTECDLFLNALKEILSK
ncbi:MAG: aspartate aminotransferase family protein [Pseudarcicella sp.]|nr:aspartate aminotransferase family protein [Pseudarcicella sp.]MBP6409473.1 aspartate aminotransferase family protein [Pseudarcicella sp.]